MASDIFAKIGDIKGESTDKQHPGAIELLSFSWGETQTGAHAFGGGAGAGKVSFQDFHFTTKTSLASPQLMLACASGKHIPTAQITMRKAGGESQGGFEFLFIKMTDVLVSSFQEAGSNAEDLPTEAVSLAFAKVDVQYKEQKPDGRVGAISMFGWDLKANRRV